MPTVETHTHSILDRRYGILLSLEQADDYAVLGRRVKEYERTWFNLRVEPQASLLAESPKRLELLRELALAGHSVSTEMAYTDSGWWREEREDLHEQIFTDLPDQTKSDEVPLPALCYFLLGRPGSGKSTVLRRVAERHAQYLAGHERPLPSRVVDADEVRVNIPEYSGGLGSSVVQREVVHMTYQSDHPCAAGARQTSVLETPAGDAVVMIDVVGDRDHLGDTVRSVLDRGWQVYVLCTECPAEVARDRVAVRALRDRRYVDPVYLESIGSRPRLALSSVKSIVEGWALIDTSGDLDAPMISKSDGTFGRAGENPFESDLS